MYSFVQSKRVLNVNVKSRSKILKGFKLSHKQYIKHKSTHAMATTSCTKVYSSKFPMLFSKSQFPILYVISDIHQLVPVFTLAAIYIK